MAVNAQKIQQFNQANKQNQPPPNQPAGNPSPNQPQQKMPVQPTALKINSRMSVSDIALLQKDPATLSKEEVIRRTALETKETLREKEEAEEKQRQDKLEADRKAGRFAAVGRAETLRGIRAIDKGTAEQRAWIMRAPTVGGIGALLAIIVLFLMAVVPVDKSGNTRLFLIWLTLTGKTNLRLPPNVGPGSNVNTTPDTSQTPPSLPPVVQGNPTFTLPPIVQGNSTFTLPTVFQNGDFFGSLFGGD